MEEAARQREDDLDTALTKYCDFMKPTESFPEALDVGVSQPDGYIQEQIDGTRGS